jgi:hypothetical protein
LLSPNSLVANPKISHSIETAFLGTGSEVPIVPALICPSPPGIFNNPIVVEWRFAFAAGMGVDVDAEWLKAVYGIPYEKDQEWGRRIGRLQELMVRW